MMEDIPSKDKERQESKEIEEVLDEIESALKDARGITTHQKRLAFCLSLGIVYVLETYLKKKEALKKGYKIDHRLLKKKKERVKSTLAEKITLSFDRLDKLDKILDIAYNIESKRNELAYGKDISEEFLRELIHQFLQIKTEVEHD